MLSTDIHIGKNDEITSQWWSREGNDFILSDEPYLTISVVGATLYINESDIDRFKEALCLPRK